MDTLTPLVAKKIRERRKALGVTQQELGKLLGCTQQHIQNYENGFCQMPVAMLNDLADLCNIPLDWFFLEEHEMLIYLSYL